MDNNTIMAHRSGGKSNSNSVINSSNNNNARFHPATDGKTGTECPDPTNLLVNYIPTPVTDVDLRNMFEQFGEVESARVILDRTTKHPRGYGFVKYRDVESAEQAQRKMNGFQIHNKRLRVGPARGSADARGQTSGSVSASVTPDVNQYLPKPQGSFALSQLPALQHPPPSPMSQILPRLVSVQQRAGMAPQQFLLVDGMAVPVVQDGIRQIPTPTSVSSIAFQTTTPPSPNLATTPTLASGHPHTSGMQLSAAQQQQQQAKFVHVPVSPGSQRQQQQ